MASRCLFTILIWISFVAISCVISSVFDSERNILIIGIMSARDNFEKRQSMRNTWISLTRDMPVKYYFLVGEKSCHIPPSDRVTQGVCEPFEYNINSTNIEEVKYSHKNVKLEHHQDHQYLGFGFYPRHKIKITKLGVISSVCESSKFITINLVSSKDGKLLVSSNINCSTYDNLDEFYFFKNIQHIIIPQDHWLRIYLNIPGIQISSKKCSEWSNENILNFVELISEQNMELNSFTNQSCSLVSFGFKIVDDKETIIEHMNNKVTRQLKWTKFLQDLNNSLTEEKRIYNDIMLLDLVDVYSNLPMKLIKFFIRINSLENFEFVLKTDDDCFIDVLRVVKELNTLRGYKYRDSELWWWSNFRQNWKVQKTGKWSDYKYKSITYPPFPCGGGYVLNRYTVNYLVSVADDVNYFQGEDVSVGIWLSGLRIYKYKPVPSSETTLQVEIINNNSMTDYCIKVDEVSNTCSWTCDNVHCNIDLACCNKVNLNLIQMNTTWLNYKMYGYIV